MIVWALACGQPAPPPPAPGTWTEHEVAVLASLELDPKPPPDPSNKWADDPKAADLGQALFYDVDLSPAHLTCVSCHAPDKGFADGLPLGHGVGTAGRNTPSIVGSQFGPWFFWDGRADSMWSQALGPMENPVEMGSDRVFVANVVRTKYAASYTEIFGPPTDDVAVFVNAGKAIEAYERRLVPKPSAFDRYVHAVRAGDLAGGGALDASQIRGLTLFLRDGCTSCHHGPMLTDHSFHNLGIPEPKGFDPGRSDGAGKVAVSPFNCNGAYSDTKDCPELRYLNPSFPDFQDAFKTPSLRNVALTAPYMHNGSFPTLESVLAFYSELPGQPAMGHRELTLKPLHFTGDQMKDLVAFLNALTSDPFPSDLTASRSDR